MTVRPFVLHAHFYQPERLNPWTGALDPEPSAAPDRDWNERIHRECYRPNAVARIFDARRRVEQIVNNYERLSFNLGPTLLSWLERAHPETYAKVLDGDWRSAVRTGHGNALAQAYNHMILPLANERDVRTQIRWGQIDFRHRFRRDAEGMWLPETAANESTIDALIDAGVRFTVLAPHQAGEPVDTGRPYRVRHSDGSGRYLAVFFYDGGLAQSLAFDPATADAAVLVERLQHAENGGGLVHAALDGETFGHHHSFGELGLAYALFEAAEARGLAPTNYGSYLAEHAPTDDVRIADGEGTAWSCAHGVGRWYRDCGCSTDALPGWDQAWRSPLRAALDRVRDAAIEAFEDLGSSVLKDPWSARDDYLHVRLGNWGEAEFLDRHAPRSLTDDQRVDLWTLLEAQRHAMVMYTSCGWFFADVSGIETVYVLRSAARVLQLLEETGQATPRDEVLEILAEARSNRPERGNGADVWRTEVEPAEVGATRVAAHLALRGLVRPLPQTETSGGHVVTLADHRGESAGRLGLSTARMTVTSEQTHRSSTFAVAAAYLGGLDFHGVVAPYPGDARFAEAVERLWDAFPTVPLAALLRLLGETFDGEEFGLEHALPDGRQEVVGAIFSDLAGRFHEQYARLYQDHRRILEMLSEAGYALPRDLRAPAELTLSAELEHHLATARSVGDGLRVDSGALANVRDVVRLARQRGYLLDLSPVENALTAAVTEAARLAATELRAEDVTAVEQWLDLCGELGVDIDLSGAQEHAYETATKARSGRLTPTERELVAALGFRLGLSPVAWGADPA